MEVDSMKPEVPNQEVMSPKHPTETTEEEVRDVPLIQADEQVIGVEMIGQELVPSGAPGGKGKGGSATSSPPATSLELVPATPPRNSTKATEKASSHFRSAGSLESQPRSNPRSLAPPTVPPGFTKVQRSLEAGLNLRVREKSLPSRDKIRGTTS